LGSEGHNRGAFDAPIILGEISGLFGVRGEVRVFDYSRKRGDILKYDPWLIERDGKWNETSVRNSRHHQETLVVHLEGFDDRDLSRTLIGTKVAIKQSQLPKLNDGEFYWHELEGLAVINDNGHEFGTIEKFIETGANDVFVVRGEKERLIPYTKDVVIEVDFRRNLVLVKWELDY
tara:strand:+ start:202 stop:729 length:528 start_codon:yes stop_codon:yes gene_type:complete